MDTYNEIIGTSYEGLKFYCNECLVPNLKRDKNNYRVFDGRDVAWIIGLRHLKNCGMSIQEIKEFHNLCLMGKQSIPDRKIILEKKCRALIELLAQVQANIDYIDRKQEYYDQVLTGERKYEIYLVSVD